MGERIAKLYFEKQEGSLTTIGECGESVLVRRLLSHALDGPFLLTQRASVVLLHP